MKKKQKVCLLIGFALCAAISANAQSTYVTFSVDMATNIALGTFTPGTQNVEVQGDFEGWASGDTLVQQGSSGIYTNTFNISDSSMIAGTTNAQIQYEFVVQPGSSYESTADGDNRSAYIPIDPSPASFVLPTPFFGDDGAPVTNEVTFNVDVQEQTILGNFTPGTSYAAIRGNYFAGWSEDIDLTNDTVNTNVWEGTFQVSTSPNADEDFKYIIEPGLSWEEPDAIDSDSGGNRFFSIIPSTSSQTLPLVNFSDQAPSPLCTLTLGVDMSVITAEDPSYEPSSVVLWGSFNGWSDGVTVTNNPTAANPNVYSAVLIEPEGATFDDQFRYIDDSGTIYDYPNAVDGVYNNRVVTVPDVAATNITVFFDSGEFNDYLSGPVNVTFTVNMAPATEVDLTNYDGDAAIGPFNPSTDNVYVNGSFNGPVVGDWVYFDQNTWGYIWSGQAPPESAPPGFQLNRMGSSLIYSNTIALSAGTPIRLEYAYGTDPGAVYGGPIEDETANSGVYHMRVIRNTSTGNYNLPEDTFATNQIPPYQESLFYTLNPAGANLTVGSQANGTVPVKWLGRPGAQLQSSTNLLGSWQTIAATDGTNWSIGFYGTNGFVSKTNWPANGATFFRVVKQ